MTSDIEKDQILLSKNSKTVQGEIHLDGSKSLSNRVLIIQALCKDDFRIDHCSTSDDSVTLQSLLASQEETLDAHHAGTTFRFMTSYLCLQDGYQILTGSERMKQRPIGPLVDALRSIGADIEYVGEDGYPPLKIGALDPENSHIELTISAEISSQFISSLLLIAPILPHGLTIHLEGNLVSRPYLEMTLKMMEYFGIKYEWNDQTIQVHHQEYKGKDIRIEADWSAASYYYIMAALSDQVDVQLHGLFQESLQGDSAIVSLMEDFGIRTSYTESGIKIEKDGNGKPFIDYNFIKAPDIAQSIAVACAGSGKQGLFSGLQTLKIKETDRIAALSQELAKVNAFFSKMPAKFSKKSGEEYYMLEGTAKSEDAPAFDTYKDHRMAMAFAPLAMLFPIKINDPAVVSKSYPRYWEDLASLGFIIE